jgi:predicted alpha/beta-fold hydrolase
MSIETPSPTFRPFALLRHPHLQTIVSTKVHRPYRVRAETICVPLPDGDHIALRVSTPATWSPQKTTVLLIHGLCGCSRSPYLLRLTRKLSARGLRTVRMNLRGCGEGAPLARQFNHAGRSDDLREVLAFMTREHPSSAIVLVGFSLSGNIALKLAGELGDAAKNLLRRLIAVCPPIDLVACSRRLSAPGNWFYRRYFCKNLARTVAARHARFPDLPPAELPSRFDLFEFDNSYTAPQCGFDDASDYYRRSSAAPLVSRIRVPCEILFADDDPLIDSTSLDNTSVPEGVRVLHSARGGHMGFLGRPGSPMGYHWLDSFLLDRVAPS